MISANRKNTPRQPNFFLPAVLLRVVTGGRMVCGSSAGSRAVRHCAKDAAGPEEWAKSADPVGTFPVVSSEGLLLPASRLVR